MTTQQQLPQNAQSPLVSGPAPGAGGASSASGALIEVRCSCGRTYDIVTFHQLEIVGPVDAGDQWTVMLANCPCRSTIGMAFDPEGNPQQDIP